MDTGRSQGRFAVWLVALAGALGFYVYGGFVFAEKPSRQMTKRDVEIMADCVRATLKLYENPKPCVSIEELDEAGRITGRTDERLTEQLTAQLRKKWPQYCAASTDSPPPLLAAPLRWLTDNTAYVTFQYSRCEARRTWYGRWKLRSYVRD